MGDVGRGDDSADPAGVFRQGEADQGDRAGREGLGQHGAQGDPFAGDGVHLRPAVQPMPKLGPWTAELERMLEANETKSKRERLTLLRISEALEGLGYGGGYDAVRRYAKAWRWRRSASTAQTYVPLVFSPGEAYQFDWSHEYVGAGGGDDQGQGRARPAVPQPNVLRPRLSARELGDGVRRPRPGIPAVPGCLPARHLRLYRTRFLGHKFVSCGGPE